MTRYLVMAEETSANASCAHYQYHNDSFNCSVTTINELFYHLSTEITSEGDVKVVVFLPGVHAINDTRNQQWSTQSYFNLTMIGIGNVTIICISQFDFLMKNIQYLSIRNLQFKDRTGRSNKSSLLTVDITIGLYENTSVALSDLYIGGEKITGIKINLNLRSSNYLNSQLMINIINSVINTESTGIHIFQPHDDHYHFDLEVSLTLNIVNVSFFNSCFSLELHKHIYHSSRYINPITLLNTKFVGGECSPLLDFYGEVGVVLNNISVTTTQARMLIYSTVDYIMFTGNCDFCNNKGKILIKPIVEKGMLVFLTATVKLINNAAQADNVFEIRKASANVSNSNIIMENNVGISCSGITFIDVNVSFNSNVNISFTGNKGGVSAALLLYSSIISFHGTPLKLISIELSKNGGSAIVGSESKLNFTLTNLTIISNTAYGSDIYVAKSTILVTNDSLITFHDSNVNFISNQGQQCGGIMASNGSRIAFVNNSKAFFIRNLGELGGAISLSSMSVLQFDHRKSNTTLTFIDNEAQKGGAIFVDDRTYIYAHRLQASAIQKVGTATRLSFSGNMAQIGGSNIYGGWIDWSAGNGNINFTTALWNSIEFDDQEIDTIASDPLRICTCNNQVPNCSITSLAFQQLYPGGTIDLDVVVVGQREGRVLSPVMASFKENSNQTLSGRIKDLQTIQIVRKTCTRVSYTVMSTNPKESLILTPFSSSEFGLKSQAKGTLFGSKLLDAYPNKLGLLFKQFTINLELKRCPLTFPLDETLLHCQCPSPLSSLQLGCDSVKNQIIRSEQQWVGITYNHTGTNHSGVGLIAHQHCPFDYCKSSTESLSVNPEHQDEQCAHHRAGILCGGCQANYSRVVGSHKCKKCSSLRTLFAIVPSFIVAGLALIFFLTALNLTVSTGTISGLIFYANIIQAQHTTFFSSNNYPFLSTFISLLNLDQGIESCLYPGFDSYAETWLQFCFPLYIWLLATAIIVLSHYSTRISKLTGKNSVQVLATLFLLTYTKLLRLVIDVVSFTTLTYPDGYTKAVWLYDGNIDFLRGKHIPLLIATLLLVLLVSLPYTLSLVSIQWLLKISHYPIMFWVQKLKPFFDAYTGPYKAQHRYWTGMLLVVRIILLVIFSLNRSNDLAINLLCISIISFILLVWLYFTRWIYESFRNNCLELAFILNLGLTSTTFLLGFSTKKRKISTTAIHASTGMTFIIFIAIIAYHAQRKLFLTKFGIRFKNKLNQLLRHKKD